MRRSPSPSVSTSAPGCSRMLASAATLAWRRSCSRKASPASRVALPDTNVWREADVLPASGVIAVSPDLSRIASAGTPNASAMIWTITVLAPWPMSIAPWCSHTVPEASMPTFMVDGLGSEVLPQPYQQVPSPTPFLR